MSIKIKDIASCLESFAPLHYQESYDNSGLIIGDMEQIVSSVLITVDVTEDIIDEAIELKSNLIVAHHPLLFSGLKRITGTNSTERIVAKAIKNNISLYAAHTNLDSTIGGVSSRLCEKLDLSGCKILEPRQNELKKLVTFVPADHADKVRNSLFEAGAGHIGNYDSCSFNLSGKGTFRASEGANPFVGEIGELHQEAETRIEVIYPKAIQPGILAALKSSHPYEEIAYDIYSLDNSFSGAGMGMIGDLAQPMDEIAFFGYMKEKLGLNIIRHTRLKGKSVKKIAVCGGSGYFLLKNAISQKADIFISGDFKYHQFFDAENRLIIADIGHYESEVFSKEIIYDLIFKNFTTFAVYLSKVNTNPIHYF